MKKYFILALILSAFCLQVDGQIPDSLQLTRYSQQELFGDYDLLISALKEAHTGLYWYNTRSAFRHFADKQRSALRSGMTGLDFYRILAPVVAFTKEGHTSLKLSTAVQDYMRVSARYLPVFIKIINGKVYLINDLPGASTKGCELQYINGESAASLLKKFMRYEPSDGFNVTGKYRWIEEGAKFNLYYSRCFPQADDLTVVYRDAASRSKTLYHVRSLDLPALRRNYTEAMKAIPGRRVGPPAGLQLDSLQSTAILTFNTFQKRRYSDAQLNFREFVKTSFAQIREQRIKNLIIDIRRNGGGTEGYEDYLLSFMIKKDYVKYEYVQASALHYSFYSNTDYRSDWASLDSALNAEHELQRDGRILRKPGIEPHEPPQPNAYDGRLFVLISGLTYSGGAELASLMRNHTPAIFIGEETGGGYYGNTSGYRITLHLPATGMEIAIPVLKFVVATPKTTNPQGHGTMPDITIQPTITQYLGGVDPEMEAARKIAVH